MLRVSAVRNVVLPLLGAVAAYAVTTRAIAQGALVLALVAAALLAVGVVRYPRAAFIAALGLGTTVFLPYSWQISLGGVLTDPVELAVFALVGLWFVAWALTGSRRPPPIPRGTIALAAAVVLGAVVGIVNGADRQLLQGQLKSYAFYLLLLPMSVLFASSRHKQLLETWVLRLATAGSCYVLYLVARGIPVPTPDLTNAFNTLGIEADAQRVRPALLELLVLATVLVVARLLAERVTPVRLFQLGLFSTVWAFSFFRSAWVALAFACLIVACIRPGPRLPLRGLRFAVALGVVLPALWFGASTGALGPSSREVVRRLESTASPDLSRESSYTDRAQEVREATAAIRRNPVVGVGVARPYGARRPTYDAQRQMIVYQERPFSHNSYLDLYLHLGLAGIAAVLLLAAGLVSNIVSALRTAAVDDAVRAVGAGGAAVAMAIKAAFLPMLTYRPAIMALVVALTLAQPVREVPMRLRAGRTPRRPPAAEPDEPGYLQQDSVPAGR